MRIFKVTWIFSSFSFWGESVNYNSIIIISKEYHYVINLGIACNFSISIDPVYSISCARRSTVAIELRVIWVLPSPCILQSIIRDEFWQDIIESTSIKCFISTIHLHFIHDTTKVSKYYIVFTSPIFVFHIIL